MFPKYTLFIYGYERVEPPESFRDIKIPKDTCPKEIPLLQFATQIFIRRAALKDTNELVHELVPL